jgi:hypothetical protein
MNSEFKVLMVSSSGPEETVFESQVIDMVRAWQNFGSVSLLYRSAVSKQVEVDGVEVRRIVSTVPQLSRVLLHGERLLNPQWRWHEGYDVVHCRGAVGAWQILHSMNKQQRKSVKVLYDCRGIVVEEMDGTWGNSWKKVLLPLKMSEMRKIEEYVVNEVDMLTTVSEGLSEYLKMHYGRRADQIMRPVVNTQKFYFSKSDRETVRCELGIGEADKLFIFVGGGAYWQSLDLLKNWWVNIRQTNFTLLILTHTPRDYDQWVAEVSSSIGRIVVKSVPHQKVCSYMNAADFGVLFRDAGLVNNVASPVKLGEYLCTGLQVLTNLNVYKNIQPSDIQIIDLNSLNMQQNYLIRDASIREARAQHNIGQFSAAHAVSRLYDQLS